MQSQEEELRRKLLDEVNEKYEKILKSIDKEIEEKNSLIKKLKAKINKLQNEIFKMYVYLGACECYDFIKDDLSFFDIDLKTFEQWLNQYKCGYNLNQLIELNQSFNALVLQLKEAQKELTQFENDITQLTEQKNLLLILNEKEVTSFQHKLEPYLKLINDLKNVLSLETFEDAYEYLKMKKAELSAFKFSEEDYYNELNALLDKVNIEFERSQLENSKQGFNSSVSMFNELLNRRIELENCILIIKNQMNQIQINKEKEIISFQQRIELFLNLIADLLNEMSSKSYKEAREYLKTKKTELSNFDFDEETANNELNDLLVRLNINFDQSQLKNLKDNFISKIQILKETQHQLLEIEDNILELKEQRNITLENKEQEIACFQQEYESFMRFIKKITIELSGYGVLVSDKFYGKNTYPLGNVRVSDTGVFPNKVEICTTTFSNKDFGISVFEGDLGLLEIPFFLDLKSSGSTLINVDSDFSLDIVEKYIISFMISFFSSIPTNNISFGFYSPFCNSMPSVNAFINASIKNGLSIQQEMFQNRSKFTSLLSLIHQRADSISEKLFSNKCNDFIELCEKGASLDKAQIIFIHNFLSDIGDEELRELLSCVKGYQRCGVYFILVDSISNFNLENRSKRFLSYVAELVQICDTFNLNKDEFNYLYHAKLNEENGKDISLVCEKEYSMRIKDFLQSATPQMVYDFCIKACDVKAKNEKIVDFKQIKFYENNTQNDYDRITIPIGVNYPTVWEMEFGSVGNSPIANFIVGEPGTGKSQLINTIILSGAKKYSPDELIFHLIDFKNNSDLNAFMTSTKIPHVKAILTSVKEEDSTIILSNLLIECEKRIDLFKELSDQLGRPIRNIGEYNREIDENHLNIPHIPKLVIIIDECQHLFVSDSLSDVCERIVREGRSQGVHLILSTQVVERKMLKTLRLISGVYCFAVGSGIGDISELFENKKYLSTMSTDIPKGSYMCYASNNRGKDCATVKIAYADKKEVQYAEEICSKWSQYPIEFAKIGDQSALQYTKNIVLPSLVKNSKDIYPLTIGINYMNEQPVVLNFRREFNSSLLMIGNNSEGVFGVFNTICMQTQNYQTYVIDASKELKLLYHLKNKRENLKTGNETSFVDFLSELWTTYEERRKDIRGDYEPVFFLVNDIGDIDDFNNNVPLLNYGEEAVDDNMEPKEDDIASLFFKKKQNSSGDFFAKECFFKMLKEASRYNIFICLSCLNLSLINDETNHLTFSSSAQYEIFKKCSYIGLFNDANDVDRIMNFSFRTSTLNSINENMMIVITRQNTMMKLKYYHFDEDEVWK